MAEEMNTQRVQAQIDNSESVEALQVQLGKIKRIIDRGFLLTFIAGGIGSLGFLVLLCLTVLEILPDIPFISIIGTVVFCVCVSFCSWYVQNAKAEYKKLLEQLQQTHNIQK
jgi:hypothetical protein